MNVLYIGNCNSLAAGIVNRLQKEDHHIFIIAKKEFPREIKPKLKYKVYIHSEEYACMEKVFSSVLPEIVVFAGGPFLAEEWRYAQDGAEYLSFLTDALNQSALHGVQKFLYLSSSHVLGGASVQPADESVPESPADDKGLLCKAGEQMVGDFGRRYQLDAVILRMDLIYGCRYLEEEGDLPGRILHSFLDQRRYAAGSGRTYAPVAVGDCVDAIYRCMGVTLSPVYHVAGNEVLQEAELAELLSGCVAIRPQVESAVLSSSIRPQVESAVLPPSIRPLDNSLLKQELEWVPIHTFREFAGQYRPDAAKKEKNGKREWRYKDYLYMIENVAVFLVFAALQRWCRTYPVLAAFDVISLYVLLMSLMFGIRRSILSVILACGFYILQFQSAVSVVGILTNVDMVFHLAQYIFIGVTSGYTVDYLNTKIRETDTEYQFLQKEYEEIREINYDNILIKHEYEKRLLNYNSSLPKLYTIISRMDVLEPERILGEIVTVVREILEVETVAVYLTSERSSYMRLIAASDENAVFQGKAVDLNLYPEMRRKLYEDELFISDTKQEAEPAIAAPIFYRNTCIAVIVVKELPFQNLNLYRMNLLRTLLVLIRSSIVKAKDYEESVKSRLYHKDTEVLYPYEFRKLLLTAKEKRERKIADCSVLRIDWDGPLLDVYNLIVNVLRNTDHFGSDEAGNLYVLLGNTSDAEAQFAVERLRTKGVEPYLVDLDALCELIG